MARLCQPVCSGTARLAAAHRGISGLGYPRDTTSLGAGWPLGQASQAPPTLRRDTGESFTHLGDTYKPRPLPCQQGAADIRNARARRPRDVTTDVVSPV